MTKNESLEVGLRLVGIYIAALGCFAIIRHAGLYIVAGWYTQALSVDTDKESSQASASESRFATARRKNTFHAMVLHSIVGCIQIVFGLGLCRSQKLIYVLVGANPPES